MNGLEQPPIADAIYVVLTRPEPDDHIRYALSALGSLAKRRIVVCPSDYADSLRAILADRPGDVVLPQDGPSVSLMQGYKSGLLWLWSQGEVQGDVLLTGSHVIGPLLPLDPRALDLAAQGADIYAPYWHNAKLDHRLRNDPQWGLLPSLDFTVISGRVLSRPEFRSFFQNFKPAADYWEEFRRTHTGLSAVLSAIDSKVIYPMPETALETFNPSTAEIHRLVAYDAPCFPIAVLRLDPILHDLYSVDLKIALDDLRLRHPQIYELVIKYVSRNIPPRDFAMATDSYEVLPIAANQPTKTDWAFGRIAVFIHAYYPEMMPEFWGLLQNIPCGFDVFVTTANAESRDQIDLFLKERGVSDEARQVVVVAQNRGRDMSSLFISFRDVVLSGKYAVALRLHSKRTPQVSRQVGENFKSYLFENLVGSRGYVANILDRFEQEPDIGMIMPPVVHVGFGTLGHSWFNNFAPMAALAAKMDIKVNYDADTPLAPLGTMYWFRTDALHKMFAWPWAWEDYNPEPRHIDGGLAHVQERLICYACVDRGYRVVMAMTPAQAGRNYAKLEYKLQLLAARLASGNIMFQRDQLDMLRGSARGIVLRRLMEIYGSIVRRFPWSRRALRPMGHFVRRILNPKT